MAISITNHNKVSDNEAAFHNGFREVYICDVMRKIARCLPHARNMRTVSPPAVTAENSAFCRPSVLMGFLLVWFSEQRAFMPLKSITDMSL
jgi:hypothetical protein